MPRALTIVGVTTMAVCVVLAVGLYVLRAKGLIA